MRKSRKPRILIWDIESSLSVVATFSPYVNYIGSNMLIKDWNIICASWKWLGQKKVHSVSVLGNPKSYDISNDKLIVKKLAEVIEQADVIVAHNGDKFDTKKLNARLLYHGMKPINIPPSVDTLKVAKKEFKLSYNNLDYLAKYLGLDSKMDMDKGAWMSVLQGNKKSIRDMVKYNKVDVEVLENVYTRLRPYITNHPRVDLACGPLRDVYASTATSCASCGSYNIIANGIRKTKKCVYKRFLCKDCASSTQGPRFKL